MEISQKHTSTKVWIVFIIASIIIFLAFNSGLFFEHLTLGMWVAFIALFVIMIAINEFARYNLWTGLITFVFVPLIFLIFVWPHTQEGTNVDNWFQHAKIVTALGSAWIFIAIRFSKKAQSWNWFKTLPLLILVVNILEAVSREFEISHMTVGQTVSDMYYIGGAWNTVNAWAGIINILTICGWFGIYISKDKQKTMIWPDMLWFWILAYDLWNYAYSYNCLGDRSFYIFPVLFSATLGEYFIRKGGWIQHRGFTLSINNIIMFTFPALFVTSGIAVGSSWNPAAMWTLSILSIVSNVMVACYQIYTIVKYHKNPLKDELYTHTNAYKEIIEYEKNFETTNDSTKQATS